MAHTAPPGWLPKEAIRRDHCYGPWALLVDGGFAGWGCLRPEGNEVDLALVLRPAFWGHGRAIAERILAEAFGPRGFHDVTVLLPTHPGHRRRAAVRVPAR